MLCENLINKPIKLIKCNSNYLLGSSRKFKFQIIADQFVHVYLQNAVSTVMWQVAPLKRKVGFRRREIKVIV